MPALFLSLGSNLGDREANLEAALEGLLAENLSIERVSSVYETEPVGAAAGPRWFLNAAARGDTSLGAAEVLARCRTVEGLLGRTRTVPGGPRTIDIDLLMLGDLILEDPACTVPHPRMHLRRFVLEPLAEIAPEARHPGLGLTVLEMLGRLTDPSPVVRRGTLPLSSLVVPRA